MRIGLVLNEAAQGLRRNVTMVVSIVLVTFISLSFVGTAVLLQLQIGQMKDYWYDRAQVAVFLCTAQTTARNCSGVEATQDQKQAIEQRLKDANLAPYIAKSFFEDHQQAYQNFQKQFKDTPTADYVTPDMLNESYRLNLKDPSDASVLVEALSNQPGVESVSDERRLLDQIFNVLNASSVVAIGIAVIMLVAAALLIATTIRLSAFSRRRELGIMRLVGASNRFIQTPFVLEGVIAGLVGSLLAGIAVVALVKFVVGGLQSQLHTFTFVGMRDALFVVPLLIVVGVALAALSAGVAIRRYLRV